MTIELDKLMSSAVAAQNSQQFRKAEKIYYSILDKNAFHPEANHNLGILKLQLGENEKSLYLFKQAIEANPKVEQFWITTIIYLFDLKHFNAIDELIKQSSKFKIFDNLSQKNMGLYLKIGNMYLSLKRLNEAKNFYLKAINTDIENYKAFFGLGTCFMEAGFFDMALENYEKVIQIKPNFFEVHNNVANIYRKIGKFKEAEQSFLKALNLKPDSALILRNFGVLQQELGRVNEAEINFIRAIELEPLNVEAYRNLSLLKKWPQNNKILPKMITLFNSGKLSEKDLSHICFAIAKFYEDIENYEKAFNFYSNGNKYRKKILGYDISKDQELFNKVKKNSQKIIDFKFLPEKDNIYPVPIFITGMPRSGTTLVEQIICSHSQVCGCGELNYIEDFGKSIAIGDTLLDQHFLAEFREMYLAQIKKISNSKNYITDKMPLNFIYIGLILKAMPESKIIHITRDSRAVKWANFKQYFSSSKIGFCYDMNDIKEYFELYSEIMNYWNKLYPKQIINIDYEALTNNPSAEIPNLIGNLNLCWEDACKFPEKNNRFIKTASNVQIRKKIYKGSSKQWEKYKPFLGDL